MREKKSKIVINTGPIISLVAATGRLDTLQKLFDQVYVPLEVKDEILKPASKQFAAREFINAAFLAKAEK
jgi:predicted nucleic acid-binding protein